MVVLSIYNSIAVIYVYWPVTVLEIITIEYIRHQKKANKNKNKHIYILKYNTYSYLYTKIINHWNCAKDKSKYTRGRWTLFASTNFVNHKYIIYNYDYEYSI